MSGLVLSRKVTETIIANGPMTIRVVRISHNRVKLLCEANPDVSIRRGELERKEPTDDKHACRVDDI